MDSQLNAVAFSNGNRTSANFRADPVAPSDPITGDADAVARARRVLATTGLTSEWPHVSVDRPYTRPSSDRTGTPGRADTALVEVTFDDRVGPRNQQLNFVRIGLDERDGELVRLQSRTGWIYVEPRAVMSRAEAAAVIRRLFAQRGWPWPGDSAVAEALTLGVTMPTGSMLRPADDPLNQNFGDDYSYRLWRQRHARLAYSYIVRLYGAVIDAENGRPLMEGGTKSVQGPRPDSPTGVNAGVPTGLESGAPEPNAARSAPAALWLGLAAVVAALLGAGWLAQKRKPAP